MEGNKILNTATGLHSVNELLKKYVREQSLSHEAKRDIWLFYKSINDTNSLIDFAETAAHENIDELLSDANKLLEEAKTCTAIYQDSEATLSHFEGKTASEWFEKPFKEAYQKEHRAPSAVNLLYDDGSTGAHGANKLYQSVSYWHTAFLRPWLWPRYSIRTYLH